MKLSDIVNSTQRRLLAPIVTYPCVSFTGQSALANLKDAELQARTVTAIAQKYDLDVVMPFLDLTVEAEALGLPILFNDNESPTVLEHPLKTVDDLKKFTKPGVETQGRFPLFLEVTRRLRQSCPNRMLGAHVIGPFTLAGLMMGAESLAINTIIDPDLCKKTVDFTTQIVIDYAQAQIKAGADFIVLIDPSGVLMSPSLYDEFVGESVKRIVEAIGETPLVLHTCGNTTPLVPNMCRTGAQGLSLDGCVDFVELGKIVPHDVILIGNLDPVRVMYNLNAEGVYTAVIKFLSDMAHVPNLILSTGCDLPLETPIENIDAFCHACRDFNAQHSSVKAVV